jgi:hypothetical protein
MKADLDRNYYGEIGRGEFNVTVGTLTMVSGLRVPAAELSGAPSPSLRRRVCPVAIYSVE